MKKMILFAALMVGGFFIAKAQNGKSPAAAQQKAQFTPEEEAKLLYISKQQEMAANFYRKNVGAAQGFFEELLKMMDSYISKSSGDKQSKMKAIRDKVSLSSDQFEQNFSEIYNQTKQFSTLL